MKNIFNNNDEFVESVLFDEERNVIEVVNRKPSNMIYAVNPPRPSPDKVWKNIYGVVDGKIKLIEQKEGRHITAKLEPEKIVFE